MIFSFPRQHFKGTGTFGINHVFFGIVPCCGLSCRPDRLAYNGEFTVKILDNIPLQSGL